MITTFTVLSCLGIAQSLILSLVYFTGHGNHQQNTGLAGLFLLFSTAMLTIMLSNSIYYEFSYLLGIIEYFLTFSVGPVLWLTVQDLQGKSWNNSRTLILHLVPAVLYLLTAIGAMIAAHPLYIPILIPLLHMQAYSTWLVITTWHNHHNKDKQPFSSAGQGWLKLLSVLLIILHSSQWVRFVLPGVEYLEFLVPVTGFAIMYGLIIYGFMNPGYYSESGQSATQYDPVSLRNKLNLLEQWMRENKMFTHRDLTLDQLAGTVDIPSREISYIINKGLNKNFNEWINQYRVNLVKEMLDDHFNRHLTIDALAEEAGFNSRSSFYDAFKKITGTTPTGYKNSR